MFSKLDSKVFGGTMLIAGTSIGAAILAMPIMTGLFGFFGTVAIMLGCWLFMYWTATLILEASLCFEDGVSFIGMARRTLGGFGSGLTWTCFLLLFYSLLAAYLSGSGRIIVDALETLLSLKIPPYFEILPLLILFTPFIYFGLAMVDWVNRFLMIGMFIAYGIITLLMVPNITIDYLEYTNWSFSLLSFSVVVTSFGYHVIIPTLVSYLNRDIKKVKACLFYGSLIPLLVYFLWELSILGSVPVSGTHGLARAFIEDMPLAKLLRIHTGHNLVALLAQAFSIFAIITSFLGVAQGLFDFLKDGINAGQSHRKRSFAFVLTFLPPILMIISFEAGFIALLEYAGALVSIILGIVPIIIVWRLRASKAFKPVYRARANKFALVMGVVFFAFVVVLVVLKNTGHLIFDMSNL